MIYQYRWADMTAMVRATAAINGNVSDRRHRIRSAWLGDLGMEPGGTVNTHRITPLNEESFNLLAVFWASHRLLLSSDTVQQQ